MAPAPTEIYTLSLHDALPILIAFQPRDDVGPGLRLRIDAPRDLGHLRVRLFEDLLAHREDGIGVLDRKSTRLNSSHGSISYAVFCLKKKKSKKTIQIYLNVDF